MILLEKWYLLTHLQKIRNNVGDLGKLIVAKVFKKLSKVQKIAQSGHTAHESSITIKKLDHLFLCCISLLSVDVCTYIKLEKLSSPGRHSWPRA